MAVAEPSAPFVRSSAEGWAGPAVAEAPALSVVPDIGVVPFSATPPVGLSPSAAPGERSTAVMGGLLVGAVVLVLGFGSGIGAVVTRSHDSFSAGGPAAGVAPPVPTGGVVASSGPMAGMGSAGAVQPVAAESSGRAEERVMGTGPPHPSHGDFVTAGASGGGAADPVVPGTAGPSGCVAGPPPGALGPLTSHLRKAHLEEAPSEQVADLLNLDQYARTHTVLVEDMLAAAGSGPAAGACR